MFHFLWLPIITSSYKSSNAFDFDLIESVVWFPGKLTLISLSNMLLKEMHCLKRISDRFFFFWWAGTIHKG